MKNSFTYILFLIVSIFSFSFVSADLIPPNSHPLNLCVEVVNLEQFPDINLIGYIVGPMIENFETYPIESDKCLTKGYKFNLLSIYNGSVELDNLLLEEVKVYGGYVNEDDPLIKKKVEYSLVELDGTKIVLYKSKEISSYNDGSEDKVELFEASLVIDPLDPPVPDPSDGSEDKVESLETSVNNNPLGLIISDKTEEKSFWKSILCFFGGIFGKGCK